MASSQSQQQVKHRWRFYETSQGQRPAEEYLDSLPDDDFVKVSGAMKDVAVAGLSAARHLRGDIYEVRVSGRQNDYRVLFAPEGNHDEILLALEAFPKKTQKTPARAILAAERRLHDWRERGAALRAEQAKADHPG